MEKQASESGERVNYIFMMSYELSKDTAFNVIIQYSIRQFILYIHSNIYKQIITYNT